MFLVVLAGVFVLSYLRNLSDLRYLSLEQQGAGQETKKTILRAAIVADSHNENDLLEKALRQAQGKGVNFVIGLGDYTNLGTIEELNKAKETFEASKLDYYLTAGDRDGWESRKLGNVNNFESVFGKSTQVFEKEGIQFVLLDNSDLYKGIVSEDWEMFDQAIEAGPVTTFLPVSAPQPFSSKVDNPNLDTNFKKGGVRAAGNPSSRATHTKLKFIFVHKTPFHPESAHVMGEESTKVARQADELVKLIEENKVSGLFSGDLHFFAKFKSPSGSVKMTTVGAVSAERNFQGPRFGILTVFDDYSWEVEDVEIR